MDTRTLERCIITYAAEQVESGKLKPKIRTHRDFAAIAFPERGEALWKVLRRGNGKASKVQVLTIEYFMA